jgi:hypothetical protein
VQARHLPESPLYVVGVTREPRLLARSNAKTLTEQLARKAQFEGETFYVLLEGENKVLLKKTRRLARAKLF